MLEDQIQLIEQSYYKFDYKTKEKKTKKSKRPSKKTKRKFLNFIFYTKIKN